MSGNAKNSILKFQNIVSGDMSQATITSSISNIQFLDDIGIQLVWTGTSPVGTAAVEISIDHAQDSLGNVTVAGTWTALSAGTAVSGNSGNIFFDVYGISAPWIRVKYTKTSGIGTLNSYLCAKAI